MWPVHVVRTFCVSISVKKVTTEWRHVSRAVCQQRWRLCSKKKKNKNKKLIAGNLLMAEGKLKRQCDLPGQPVLIVNAWNFSVISFRNLECTLTWASFLPRHPCCSATWEQQSVKAPLCVALSVHCGGGGRREELWSSCWWLWKQGALRWLSLASCPPQNLTVSFGINGSQTVWHEDGPTDRAGGAGAQGQPGLGHACKCAFKVRNRKFLFPLLNLCEYLGWNS